MNSKVKDLVFMAMYAALFACVSFLRVRKKGELPAPYMTVTLGMPYRLHTDRDMAVSEPYPGRWTTHFVISSPDQLDDVFFHWLTEAYAFAMEK